MWCWEERKPTCKVFLLKGEWMTCKKNQGIQNCAPRNALLLARIVKVSSTEQIFCQDQEGISRVPNRDGPVPDQLRKGADSPAFVGSRHEGNVGRTRGVLARQLL